MVETLIENRGLMSLDEIYRQAQADRNAVQDELADLVRDGRVTCLEPVMTSGLLMPEMVYYRWRCSSDRICAWQTELLAGREQKSRLSNEFLTIL